MKQVKLFAFILLTIINTSCEDKNNSEKKLFSINTSQLKQTYVLNDTILLDIKNENKLKIDSVRYSISDATIGTTKNKSNLKYILDNQKLGYQTLEAVIFYDGKEEVVATSFNLGSNINLQEYTYTIVNTYPHDSKAYTQGLEFHNGILLEGTGQYGTSTLRKTDYKTGNATKKIDLDQKYFGEGITVLNNKLYQLTWQNNKGFIYDANTFEKIKDFDYFKNMEGWGLTNDGEKLYMSVGTEKIYILDPETLKEVDHINVYTKTTKIEALNELEWIDGKIWANVYQKDAIAVINPKTGAVEGLVNLSDLKEKITKNQNTDVLNGIAYNPVSKTIFVTGKNWDKMFEIKVNIH